MIRIPAVAVLLAGVASASVGTAQSSPDKVPSSRDFRDVRREVETLRGKKFIKDVPVYNITEKELRAISDRELDKEFPGPKLHSYEELLAWLDIVPPGTELKSAYADFFVGQVAGLYDSQAKEMSIPSLPGGATNPGKKAAEKKLEEISPRWTTSFWPTNSHMHWKTSIGRLMTPETMIAGPQPTAAPPIVSCSRAPRPGR